MITDARLRKQSLLAVHGSVLLLGIGALFSRWVHLPATELNLLRGGIATLVVLLVLLLLREKIALPSRQHYAYSLLLGVLLGLHWITYYGAMQIASIAVGVISFFSYPVMVIVMEPLFHGQRPHARDLFKAALVLLGVGLMPSQMSFNDSTAVGAAMGVFSGLLFALRNVLQRLKLREVSSLPAFFWQGIVVSLMLFLLSDTSRIAALPLSQWQLLLLAGVFTTACAHVLLIRGLQGLSAKTVGLITALNPMYAIVFAVLLLHEIPSGRTLFGGAIVTLVAIWESVSAGNEPPLEKTA